MKIILQSDSKQMLKEFYVKNKYTLHINNSTIKNENRIVVVKNKVTSKKFTLSQERIKFITNKQGLPGIDGKSAYQLALDNGFVGNYMQWLESLKVVGPPGKDAEEIDLPDLTLLFENRLV